MNGLLDSPTYNGLLEDERRRQLAQQMTHWNPQAANPDPRSVPERLQEHLASIPEYMRGGLLNLASGAQQYVQAAGRGETGELPQNVIDAALNFAPIGMVAYHGSPYKFDKFSMDKIGTGEGAQAYGHGLYFAENPGIANFYQKKLTVGENYVDGKLLDTYNPRHLLAKALSDSSMNKSDALADLQSMARPGGSKSVADTARKAIELLKKGESPTVEHIKPAGNLYKVDIADDAVKNFLDWDKPLSQQPEAVRKAINRLAKVPELKHVLGDALQPFEANSTRGETIHHLLDRYYQGDRTQVSGVLKRAGIPGIRYLDQGSRQGGKGTSNFVVFDEDIVKILERNGGLLE